MDYLMFLKQMYTTLCNVTLCVMSQYVTFLFVFLIFVLVLAVYFCFCFIRF